MTITLPLDNFTAFPARQVLGHIDPRLASYRHVSSSQSKPRDRCSFSRPHRWSGFCGHSGLGRVSGLRRRNLRHQLLMPLILGNPLGLRCCRSSLFSPSLRQPDRLFSLG